MRAAAAWGLALATTLASVVVRVDRGDGRGGRAAPRPLANACPASTPPRTHTQAAAPAVCDAKCEHHVRLAEAGILAVTILVALGSAVAFMAAIDTPTRFLGGAGAGEQ